MRKFSTVHVALCMFVCVRLHNKYTPCGPTNNPERAELFALFKLSTLN